MNNVKTNDRTEDFNVLNNYFNICHQYETISQLNENQSLMFKKNEISRLESDSFRNRSNRTDEKLQNRSNSKSICPQFINSSDYEYHIKDEKLGAIKPPRPPPPANSDQLSYDDSNFNSIFFSNYSTSSPLFVHQPIASSNLNFLYRHSRTQNQTNKPGINHTLKQEENLDKCLGENS